MSFMAPSGVERIGWGTYRSVRFGNDPSHHEKHIEMRIGFLRTRRRGRHMVSSSRVRPAPPAECAIK
jgi:hypothetical protein